SSAMSEMANLCHFLHCLTVLSIKMQCQSHQNREKAFNIKQKRHCHELAQLVQSLVIQDISTEVPLMSASSVSRPVVTPFFDEDSNTFSYVVKDPDSNACALIDSVLNLDYPSGTISHEGADAMLKHVRDHNLKVEWIIETHAHAD